LGRHRHRSGHLAGAPLQRQLQLRRRPGDVEAPPVDELQADLEVAPAGGGAQGAGERHPYRRELRAAGVVERQPDEVAIEPFFGHGGRFQSVIAFARACHLSMISCRIRSFSRSTSWTDCCPLMYGMTTSWCGSISRPPGAEMTKRRFFISCAWRAFA